MTFRALSSLSPTAISADISDYNPPGLSYAGVLRISATTSVNMTGLAGGQKGRVIFLHNGGSGTVTLKDSSASSQSPNQFVFGGDIVLASHQGIILQWDDITKHWHNASGLPVAAGGILESQVAPASGTGLLLRRQGHWTYDATVQSGVVGTVAMIGTALPINAVVRSGAMYVKTSPVGSGASIAIQIEGANDFITAAAISGAPWSTPATLVVSKPVPQTANTWVKTTAARTPSVVITSTNLSAGAFEIFAEYDVLANP